MSPVRVSVIVPVLNDATRLASCLEALERQTLTEPFEVVVVDNGSSDDPGAVVARHEMATLLVEPEPSSYAARNRGAAAARGSILAFTDADCLPADDWLERGVARLTAEGAGAFVGGPVRAFAQDPARPTAAELYEAVHAFPQRRYLEDMSFSVTANLLVTRELFDRVGPFNGALISGGDWEWGQRAGRSGARAVFAPDVVVAHPSRRTLREMHRKNRRRLVGLVQLERQVGYAPMRPPVLRRIARPPLRSTVRNLRAVSPPSARSRVLYAGASFAVHYVGAYHEARLRVRRTAV